MSARWRWLAAAALMGCATGLAGVYALLVVAADAMAKQEESQ